MSRIKEQCEGIRAALDGRLDGAKAYIATDFVNAWEILLNKPGTCKVAILFESEKARVNFAGGDITGRVNRYIDVMISRGRGLKDVRSDNLTEGVGGGKPLFELAEDMRDILRCLRFDPVTDEVPDYIGLERWGKDEGFNIDAFKCSIWIGTQLQLPTSENGANVSAIL